MPDIKHSIVIEAAAERVYELTASGVGFAKWWAQDVRQGSDLITLGFFKRSTEYQLQPIRLAAPRHAEWLCQSGKEWKNTRLIFEFAGMNGRTSLRFTHAGWQAETEYFTSCNTTWGELMFRLKAAAEGKKPGALFSPDGLAY